MVVDYESIYELSDTDSLVEDDRGRGCLEGRSCLGYDKSHDGLDLKHRLLRI